MSQKPTFLTNEIGKWKILIFINDLSAESLSRCIFMTFSREVDCFCGQIVRTLAVVVTQKQHPQVLFDSF
jgi:hypothetical protein